MTTFFTTASTPYRYTLQRYAGRPSRYTCPSCHKLHCFTRYLDTAKGELLAAEYGRCDHEVSCGYHCKPDNANIYEPLGIAPFRPTGKPAAGTAGLPPLRFELLPICTIPEDVFTTSVHPSHYPDNALARLLRQHFGMGVANDLMRRFQLGTSAYWPGACVFWLVDEAGRIRGGQVVLYDETGHTVKTPTRHTRWVHTAYEDACRRLGLPLPAWLVEYTAHGQKSPSLFGLPQLKTARSGDPVAIVESAKTAMMATPYLPQFVWMATMGLGNLTEARLRPLKNRRITLFPDAGAFDLWSRKADELRRLGYDITVSDLLEKVVTADERKAGLDLADILLREWPGYPPSWDEKG